jgi:hypothetical protein
MKPPIQLEIVDITEKEFSAAAATSLGPSKPMGEVGCSRPKPICPSLTEPNRMKDRKNKTAVNKPKDKHETK